jgi:hypothetical protein
MLEPAFPASTLATGALLVACGLPPPHAPQTNAVNKDMAQTVFRIRFTLH